MSEIKHVAFDASYIGTVAPKSIDPALNVIGRLPLHQVGIFRQEGDPPPIILHDKLVEHNLDCEIVPVNGIARPAVKVKEAVLAVHKDPETATLSVRNGKYMPREEAGGLVFITDGIDPTGWEKIMRANEHLGMLFGQLTIASVNFGVQSSRVLHEGHVSLISAPDRNSLAVEVKTLFEAR